MNDKVTVRDIVVKAQEKFTPDCGVSFNKEQTFAIQQLEKNEHIYNIALNNKKSVLMAMANVANVGLSLNPATKYAYLVPRDGAIHLDISYIGLIKIATDAGSIKWVRAEVVREGDNYISNGVCQPPIHEKPKNFGKRGDVLGVYCIAKTWDGDYLVEEMDIDAINEVRSTSKAQGSQYSPWNTFFPEMCKKTVIKRASKTWPKTDRMERLDNAIHVINQHEGLVEELPTEQQYKLMSNYAELYGKDENHVARIADKPNMTSVTAPDATKIISYINRVKKLEDSVMAIKSAIERGDTVALFECVSELDDDEYSVITKAPTKGGPLTVDERKYIMSDEWRSEIQAIEEMKAEEELDKQQLRSQQ